MGDLDLPIALRRSRRCNACTSVKSQESPTEPATPRTPHGRKGGAWSSDPSASTIPSGLTPAVRRTYLATPKSQRSSASTRSPSSVSRPVVLNLHQTIEGRVERRLRRNGHRDLLIRIEQESRRKEQSAQAQIAKLKAEVMDRDKEIYDLQNATVIMDTERIWLLERQVEELQDELAAKSSVKEGVTKYYSWTKASSDASTRGMMDVGRDEDHFGENTKLQLQASTPKRAVSSFMTPPATSSPRMPASPFFRAASPTPTSRDVRSYCPDSDKQLLEEEIASLHFEINKLTATLDSYHALGARIGDALSNGVPEEGKASSTLEAIENQVQLLLQTLSDRAAAASNLTSAIEELGFPGDNAGEMILSLAASLRTARIELEYLTPGEISLPPTPHGAQVLDLLLMHLRESVKRSREDEESIEGYLEVEQSLRRQLQSQVSVMDELNEKISGVYRMVDDKENDVRDLEISNDRLQGAVDGYVRDIAELEELVQRMAKQHRESTNAHTTQQNSSKDLLAAKDATIIELEAKIEQAVIQTAELLKEMSTTEVNLTRQTATMSRQHVAALALRDARVSELRAEFNRVNEALRVAQETIHALRIENSEMKGQLEEEKREGKETMDSMREELQRVLHLSQTFLGKSGGAASSRHDGVEKGNSRTMCSGGYQRNLRRRSKLPRRHDSGLELLNEDEADI